jgi:hypothetical protein
MSNQYEIEYQIIMRGGKANVTADSFDEAVDAFCSGSETIKQTREPTPETTVKRVTKLEG